MDSLKQQLEMIQKRFLQFRTKGGLNDLYNLLTTKFYSSINLVTEIIVAVARRLALSVLVKLLLLSWPHELIKLEIYRAILTAT